MKDRKIPTNDQANTTDCSTVPRGASFEKYDTVPTRYANKYQQLINSDDAMRKNKRTFRQSDDDAILRLEFWTFRAEC